MKNNNGNYNNEHLQNIKGIFEDRTGVLLAEKKSGFAHRKLVAAAFAAILCLSMGTPVLAAKVPAIYELMYLVSPGIAQFFMPVQKSDVDNGVKMEVISAYIHDSAAEVYITMQDLTGDRIDGTTDLYDSYSINCPFNSSAACQRIGYDEKTKTVTFLITINEWDNQKIAGDKITFSVKEFLSHKKKYNNIEIPINLTLVTSAESTQKVYSTGGGGRDYHYTDNGKSIVLTPSEAITGFPVDGIDVSAIGYIDDKLHVQMAISNHLKNDNHGSFYLKNSDGTKVEDNYNIYFTNHYERQEDRIDYCEYVFNLSQEELKDYSLYGNFVTSGSRTKGNWSVTFPLEQTEE